MLIGLAITVWVLCSIGGYLCSRYNHRRFMQAWTKPNRTNTLLAAACFGPALLLAEILIYRTEVATKDDSQAKW